MASQRAQVRAGIAIPQRVALLEDDADGFESVLESINTRLSTLLGGVALASILLAVNAAVILAGR
jgi:hypothetical protein